jgi:ParB-like chromosome segregation protein Spo0J
VNQPKYQTVPFADLRTAPRNANQMTEEQLETLQRFMKRVGFLQPIVVVPIDTASDIYEIVDGHHRAKAWEGLGHTEIDCVVLQDLESAKEFISLGMNLNKGTLLFNVAAEMLQELSQDGYSMEDLALIGMPTSDIEALLAAAAKTSDESLEDLLKESAAPPNTSETAKPYTLELSFADKALYNRAKKFLQKADPANGDMVQGLVNLMD